MVMEVCCLVDKSIFFFLRYELLFILANSRFNINIENLNLLFCFVFFVDIYFEIFDDANLLEDRGAHNPVVRILWLFPLGFLC